MFWVARLGFGMTRLGRSHRRWVQNQSLNVDAVVFVVDVCAVVAVFVVVPSCLCRLHLAVFLGRGERLFLGGVM